MQRTRLFVSGVTLPKLGSVQDRVLRQFMMRESETRIKHTNLLGLIAINSAQFGNKSAAADWEAKVRRIFMEYMNLEYGDRLPEHTEKEIQMLEYYQTKVKHLRPTLHIGDKGSLSVKGLDDL